MTSVCADQIKSSDTLDFKLDFKLWEIICSWDGRSLWHISCNFVCHKMKLSLGFLIMEHYYSTQYGVSVGGQLIFWAWSLTVDPLWIVSIHLFYSPLCISSLIWISQEAGPHGQRALRDPLAVTSTDTAHSELQHTGTSKCTGLMGHSEKREVKKSVNYKT